MSSSITLKVSPDIMKAKAGEIQSQIGNIKSYWEQISQIMKNSKSYWEGDASNLHQKYKKELEEDMKHIIRRLGEHPQDLLKMADIYKETEQKVMQIAFSLPQDVIR